MAIQLAIIDLWLNLYGAIFAPCFILDVCRLYWTDVGRNTIESLGLSSMLHRFEKIPQIPEKLVADVASYQVLLSFSSHLQHLQHIMLKYLLLEVGQLY